MVCLHWMRPIAIHRTINKEANNIAGRRLFEQYHWLLLCIVLFMLLVLVQCESALSSKAYFLQYIRRAHSACKCSFAVSNKKKLYFVHWASVLLNWTHCFYPISDLCHLNLKFYSYTVSFQVSSFIWCRWGNFSESNWTSHWCPYWQSSSNYKMANRKYQAIICWWIWQHRKVIMYWQFIAIYSLCV